MALDGTEQSGNWCVESCSTTGAGDLILTGAELGYARFNDTTALGEKVWYSVLDGVNREAGYGTLQNNRIIRIPTAQLINGVYNETLPLTPMSLTGVSTVAGTFNAVSHNDLWAHIFDTGNPHQVDAAQIGAEPSLGNPSVDDLILSSSAAGVRSWVAQSSGGGGISEAPIDGTPYSRQDAGWVPETTGTSGETNTSSNSGLGAGVALPKAGVDLPFRSLSSANDRLSLTEDLDEITFTVVESNIVHQNLVGAGTYTHSQVDSHLDNMANPHMVTADQVDTYDKAAIDALIAGVGGSGVIVGVAFTFANNGPTGGDTWTTHLAINYDKKSATSTLIGIGMVTMTGNGPYSGPYTGQASVNFNADAETTVGEGTIWDLVGAGETWSTVTDTMAGMLRRENLPTGNQEVQLKCRSAGAGAGYTARYRSLLVLEVEI